MRITAAVIASSLRAFRIGIGWLTFGKSAETPPCPDGIIIMNVTTRTIMMAANALTSMLQMSPSDLCWFGRIVSCLGKTPCGALMFP